MFKINPPHFPHKWLYLAAAGVLIGFVGHGEWDDARHAGPERAVAAPIEAGGPPHALGDLVMGASSGAADGRLASGHGEGAGAHASTALDTGMADWEKAENAPLRAELQHWHDHRSEVSPEQCQADANALMAKVEARQAAGALNRTSAALAKLMLLQGAPSTDPQHAEHLRRVMTELAGQLSFGE